jgi:uncharacterized SAM-binding protein YcdF (DUF218 family)
VRRIVVYGLVTVAVLMTTVVFAGYLLFTRPHVDPLTKADAVVVLGGDEDGRIDYGLGLAREGYADTVVIADSYPEDNATIRRACGSGTASIDVICFVPDPFTTQGEAMFAADLARERGWSRLIVVSWNYHMVRARIIFDQCFGGELSMRPVPRTYDFNVFQWLHTYSYQYAALVKAQVLGC